MRCCKRARLARSPGSWRLSSQPVDHLTSSAVRLSLLFWVLSLGMEASQGEMSLPELRRVANYLGERQRLPQPALCFVALLAGEGDFPCNRQPLIKYFRAFVRVAPCRH